MLDPRWRRIRALGGLWFVDRVAAALGGPRDKALRAALHRAVLEGGAPVTWRGEVCTPERQLELCARREPAPERAPAPPPASPEPDAVYQAIATLTGDA